MKNYNLGVELAKVKDGQRYVDSENWPTIKRILHERTPYIPLNSQFLTLGT